MKHKLNLLIQPGACHDCRWIFQAFSGLSANNTRYPTLLFWVGWALAHAVFSRVSSIQYPALRQAIPKLRLRLPPIK